MSSHRPFQFVFNFKHNFGAFGLHKPLVIGEFREKNGAGMTINQLYDHAYNGGYAGGWGWSETDGNMDNMLQAGTTTAGPMAPSTYRYIKTGS